MYDLLINGNYMQQELEVSCLFYLILRFKIELPNQGSTYLTLHWEVLE